MSINMSVAHVEEVEEVDIVEITDEQIKLGLRRLARIKSNLKSIRLEISEKILDGVKDCRESVADALIIAGELSVTAEPND